MKKYVPRPVKKMVSRQLNKLGFHYIRGLGEIRTIEEFQRDAGTLFACRGNQTLESVAALKEKYETQPIIGEVRVQRLLELLAQVIDPSNVFLYCTSQLTHTLQVLESMEESGVTDRDLIVMTLIHDLGKIALLKGEKPENVECGGKTPIGENVPGSGFDNCNFSWDHADIVHARFKPYVNEKIAWLLKWHSIQEDCHPFMDARDREMFEKYYKTFVVHDRTFIFHHRPKHLIDKYFGILDEAFPKPIMFTVLLGINLAAAAELSMTEAAALAARVVATATGIAAPLVS